jgi:hypothetical protein
MNRLVGIIFFSLLAILVVSGIVTYALRERSAVNTAAASHTATAVTPPVRIRLLKLNNRWQRRMIVALRPFSRT